MRGSFSPKGRFAGKLHLKGKFERKLPPEEEVWGEVSQKLQEAPVSFSPCRLARRSQMRRTKIKHGAGPYYTAEGLGAGGGVAHSKEGPLSCPRILKAYDLMAHCARIRPNRIHAACMRCDDNFSSHTHAACSTALLSCLDFFRTLRPNCVCLHLCPTVLEARHISAAESPPSC